MLLSQPVSSYYPDLGTQLSDPDSLIGKRSAVFKLFPGEDEPLLVGRNPLLVLYLGLDVVNRVRGLHLQRDGLAGQGLYEDLHATPETKHKVESRLLLDIAIMQDEGQSAFAKRINVALTSQKESCRPRAAFRQR
jgi:hypothetical protein